MVASTRRDPEREIEYMATFRAQRARAVIIVGSRTNDPQLTARLAKEVAGSPNGRPGRVHLPESLGYQHRASVQNRAGARALAKNSLGSAIDASPCLPDPPTC